MRKLKINEVCWVFWGATAIAVCSVFLVDHLSNSPASIDIFRVLNPIAIATSVSVMIAYLPSLVDTWRNRSQPVRPGHLLTLGVMLNWAGLWIRMARWYIFGQIPDASAANPLWLYDLGLWVSIAAGAYMIAAVDIARLETADQSPTIYQFINAKVTAVLLGIVLALFLIFHQWAMFDV